MNKKKLKDSILEYAFRGGLTSHKKNESTFHSSSNNENPFLVLPENWELKKLETYSTLCQLEELKKVIGEVKGFLFTELEK